MSALIHLPRLTRLGRERAQSVLLVLAVASAAAFAAAFVIDRLVPKTIEADGPLRAHVLAAAQAPDSPDTVRVYTKRTQLAAICRTGRPALVIRHTEAGWTVDRTPPKAAHGLIAACASG